MGSEIMHLEPGCCIRLHDIQRASNGGYCPKERLRKSPLFAGAIELGNGTNRNNTSKADLGLLRLTDGKESAAIAETQGGVQQSGQPM